ncbi:DUF5005 domain-containing protein [Pedobacter psychrodurus]|uniref:DUF5005 domain-containing protein n=1 Tax=Pedobacter psychrodurus TaxID=2530456 RepID=UPI00292E3FF1|nr:DUF5005 domain-containing protein [Pedobacter psychrodurus]
MKKILFAALVFFCCTSCRKTDVDNPPSPGRVIKSFKIGNAQIGNEAITFTNDSSKVLVTVQRGTDISAIAPQITVSDGATISPASGVKINPTLSNNKVVYTVTAPSGQSMSWYVEFKFFSNPDIDAGLKLIPNTGNWDAKVKAYQDLAYDNFLTCYTGWNGGDGCFSLKMPDGNIFWSFQDSFYGIVEANRNRDPAKNTFVRNAAFMQEGSLPTSAKQQLNPLDGAGKGKTWITVPGAADGDKDLYWPGPAQIVNGEAQMLLDRLKLDGSGNLYHYATEIGVFSLPDMKLKRIYQNAYIGAFSFDSSLFNCSDGYSYIYNSKSTGICGAKIFVARVANHDLTSPWQYYTKTGWVTTAPTNEDDFVTIAENNASMPTVFEENGKTYMVSQGTCLGLTIDLWEGTSPLGPFINKRTIYKIPDRYSGSSGQNPEFLTYNSFVHPSLSKDGELVITYNINPVGFGNNFNAPGTADNYRPHVVRLYNWK